MAAKTRQNPRSAVAFPCLLVAPFLPIVLFFLVEQTGALNTIETDIVGTFLLSSFLHILAAWFIGIPLYFVTVREVSLRFRDFLIWGLAVGFIGSLPVLLSSIVMSLAMAMTTSMCLWLLLLKLPEVVGRLLGERGGD
mgnify:CR=1 FL=1